MMPDLSAQLRRRTWAEVYFEPREAQPARPPDASALPPDLVVESAPRVLLLDMNAFYASVEQQERPELRGKPLIVVPVLADTTQAIAASYEAKQLGISTGTPVAEAKASCPDIAIVLSDTGRYLHYHHLIVDLLHRYTPAFPEIRVLSVDEMACILPNGTTASAVNATALDLKRQLKVELGEMMRCSIGVGPNVFTAKVASDLQKPDGLTILDQHYPNVLAQLKLTDLPDIAEAMQARLARCGIHTVADLFWATPAELRKAWGSIVGVTWYDKLRGSLALDYGGFGAGERKTLGKSHVLGPQLRNRNGVCSIARTLTAKALEKLRAEDLGAHQMTLWVPFYARDRGAPPPAWVRTRTLDIPVSDHPTWMRAVAEALEEFEIPPNAVPRAVGVLFQKLVADPRRQLLLFGESARKHAEASAVVDMLRKSGLNIDWGATFWNREQVPARISFGAPEPPPE